MPESRPAMTPRSSRQRSGAHPFSTTPYPVQRVRGLEDVERSGAHPFPTTPYPVQRVRGLEDVAVASSAK